eukprot:m.168276 g.168276  ORF g.168276 m.168276 type:complete len:315 (+) comp17212_c1_seq1:35-979(+)
MSFGGGPRCPRCKKAVYLAEEVKQAGASWHKLCFNCETCHKSLDSSTVADKDGRIFCKGCYGKEFGPKGYGYGVGAGTLTNTGGTLENPASPAKSSPPTARSGSFGAAGKAKFGSSDRCGRCDKPVYLAEEVKAAGGKWHKLCFTCEACNKSLDSTTVADKDGRIFCKACYGKEFGPKGYGYGVGAGTLTNTGANVEDVPGFSKLAVKTSSSSSPVTSRSGSASAGSSSAGASKFGATEKCHKCNQSVYAAERVIGAGSVWHKRCFACTTCNKSLDSSNVLDNEGMVYCQACHKKNFGPKGFRGGVGGHMQDTA